MFAIDCPRHGRRVLLFSDDIRAVHNSGTTITVDYTCTCGYRGRYASGQATRRR